MPATSEEWLAMTSLAMRVCSMYFLPELLWLQSTTIENVNNVIASTLFANPSWESDEGASDTGTGTSTGNIIGFTLSEDEWTKILEGARKIIGVEEEVAPGVGANAASRCSN